MSDIKKVIIVGGGMAGLIAALQLTRQNGFACTVYELRDAPTTLGGAIGIPCNGLRLLHRLGIYDALLARGAQTPRVEMHSSRGASLGFMDVASWNQEHTGFGYLRIKRVDLLEILLDAVEKAQIPIRYSKKLIGIKEDAAQVTATFADGTSDTADLLVGCDGIHSAVRTLHVDPGLQPTYSGLSTMYSILDLSKRGPSFPRFSTPHATRTPKGIFIIFPCKPNGEEIFWFYTQEVQISEEHNTRDGWEEERKHVVDSFKDHALDLLSDVRGDWGAQLKQVVGATDNVNFYPLFKLPFGGTWSKGRTVIIGDAAHAMPPHASQGVAMAAEDVFVLSRKLQEQSLSLAEIFQQYDQVRRPRVEYFHKLAVKNGDVRKQQSPWGLWAIEMMTYISLMAMDKLGLVKFGFGMGPWIHDVDKQE
ncbi:hypothetical protein BP6252_08566 [Coleophoma cylindrospora]|uniref:FAD-binding domain-containing protein n=1 Tax=Coleophoma cylindrospora TaxID=1849047 RepID=A0A3D8R6C6_9HELO|nr:hypothetical protein BP6252_08566 [Coleophoma cylindrospora]